MANTYNLSATHRELTGRKVKHLRKEGVLPANVFGKGQTSKNIQLLASDFETVYEEAGGTSLVSLTVNGDKPISVLIGEVQVDPVSMKHVHVDFRHVNLKEKIIAYVPIELEGEAPAEKSGAMIMQSLDELEVEALPGDLPESVKIDVSGLVEVGDLITVKDLHGKIKGIEIMNEPDTVIVLAQEVKEEEEPQENVPVSEASVANTDGNEETPTN